YFDKSESSQRTSMRKSGTTTIDFEIYSVGMGRCIPGGIHICVTHSQDSRHRLTTSKHAGHNWIAPCCRQINAVGENTKSRITIREVGSKSNPGEGHEHLMR